jgi:hypothetical protein
VNWFRIVTNGGYDICSIESLNSSEKSQPGWKERQVNVLKEGCSFWEDEPRLLSFRRYVKATRWPCERAMRARIIFVSQDCRPQKQIGNNSPIETHKNHRVLLDALVVIKVM